MITSRIPALLAVASVAAFCGSASAQVKTWNFGDRNPSGSCTGTFAANNTSTTTNNGNVINCTQQPSGTVVDLTLRAYSTTGTNSTFATAAVNDQNGNGVAVYNTTETRNGAAPNHAMDNDGTGIDAMLLRFTSAEILNKITVGWSGADGDFQVLRWTGATNATVTTVQSSIVGRSASNMLQSNGGSWQLVSLVNGTGGIDNPNVTFNNFNTTNASSSYWLISAYNSGFGGTGFTHGIDAIKLLGVGTGVAVSAPGTLALAGFGLLAAGFLRRRNAA